MAEWLAEFLGWSLDTGYQTSVHTVSSYIYMGAIILVVVCSVIVVAEMGSVIHGIFHKD